MTTLIWSPKTQNNAYILSEGGPANLSHIKFDLVKMVQKEIQKKKEEENKDVEKTSTWTSCWQTACLQHPIASQDSCRKNQFGHTELQVI